MNVTAERDEADDRRIGTDEVQELVIARALGA